jgi:hypothetical protein
MNFNISNITITEEFLGAYEIPRLELFLGEKGLSERIEEVVIFEPVGRNVIGANGKIDIYLRGRISDKALLLLMRDDNENLHWELTKNKKDRVVFDKNNFENLLDEWLNI